MRLMNNVTWLAIAAFMLATISPAFGVSKEMVQLQTQVQALQDQVAREMSEDSNKAKGGEIAAPGLKR